MSSVVYYLDDKNHLENLFSKINNMKKRISNIL